MKLTYSLDRSKTPGVYTISGEQYQNTLIPTEEVFDIVKATIAKYNIDEFASKRSDIMFEAKESLEQRFGERGIIIYSLALSNYNFTEELESAIDSMNQAAHALKTQ